MDLSENRMKKLINSPPPCTELVKQQRVVQHVYIHVALNAGFSQKNLPQNCVDICDYLYIVIS